MPATSFEVHLQRKEIDLRLHSWSGVHCQLFL